MIYSVDVIARGASTKHHAVSFQRIARARRCISSSVARAHRPSSPRYSEPVPSIDTGLNDGHIPFDITTLPRDVREMPPISFSKILQDAPRSLKGETPSGAAEKPEVVAVDLETFEPEIELQAGLEGERERGLPIGEDPAEIGVDGDQDTVENTGFEVEDESQTTEASAQQAIEYTRPAQLSARALVDSTPPNSLVRKHIARDSGRTKPKAVKSGRLAEESQKVTTKPEHKREQWQTQKAALKEKFGSEGWKPRRKVSPDAMEGIRILHAQYPERFTTSVLANQFEISPEAIRRILKSKWRPRADQEESRRERWEKRGTQIWSGLAAKGVHPPKHWRELGIGTGPRRPAQDRSLQKTKTSSSAFTPGGGDDDEAAASADWMRSFADRIG